MKKQMNVRISDETRKKIEMLTAMMEITEAAVISLGVEGLYADKISQKTMIRLVKEFGQPGLIDDLVDEIVGLEGHILEDANKWQREEDFVGLMYPYQIRIYHDVAKTDFPWYVVDETRWDGHNECPKQLLTKHRTYEIAVNQQERFIKVGNR